MNNWIELNEIEDNYIWNLFIEHFNFKKENFKKGSLSFDTPIPYITYDISEIYDQDYELIGHSDLNKDLYCKVERAFIDNIRDDEYIYALDYHHPCYWFNPRLPTVLDEFGEWPIRLYPDGDYYFFIKSDLSWGYLGHPWHNTVSIFGIDLIKSIEKNKPLLFKKIVEKSFDEVF